MEYTKEYLDSLLAKILKRVRKDRELNKTAEGMPHVFFEHGFNTLDEIGKNNVGRMETELISSGRMHQGAEDTLRFFKSSL